MAFYTQSLKKLLRTLTLIVFVSVSTACSLLSDREEAEAPEPVAAEGEKVRVNRVFTKINGIDDRAIRVAALKGIELRGLKRKASATEAQIRRLFKRAPKQIAAGLEPFGYYQPVIKDSLTLNGDRYNAFFEVDLGKRTQITAVNFKIEGPAELDERVNKAWRKIAIKVGEPLDHARYEAAKNEVQRALLSRGYLDYELIEHRIDVSRKNATAEVFLKWQSGARYALGETRFNGGQFDEAFLSRYLTYDVGDLYTQSRLLTLQQRLVDADYFSVVEIAPEMEEAKDGTVPISIDLVPAKRSVYTYGLSFGTDSGAGVRAGLERRWVNQRGHKLRTSAEASQRLKTAVASYDIPMPDRARTTYSINAAYRDQETDTARSKLTRLGVARTRDWKGWQETYALSWLSGDFEVGRQFGSSTLFYPELILYKRNADDFLYPREGYALTINARAGSDSILSDTSFANASIEGKYITSLNDQTRLLARVALGALYAKDFDKLPPELRFFAGGDRSIRGYGYQELGPLNNANEVRGGKYLAVISGEYEYSFNDTWGVAGFGDIGNAFDSNGSDAKPSVGAGLRWRSPVGLVRVDVAYALDEKEIRPHLIIGPDL
jgi:translocation and assembly module TamA